MSKTLVLKPRASEKSFGLSEERNTYAFEVPPRATKLEIAKAVSAQYEVSVIKVRIASVPGKKQRSYRRGGRIVHHGRRSATYKAYVTLKEGDKLPIFAAVEDDKNPAKEKK